MKVHLIILALLFFLVGCNDRALNLQETVAKYYDAKDTGNFKELQELVHDSIMIASGDYVMYYNHDNFYEQFQWDSIFKPSYKVVELEEKNGHIFVSIAQDNVRNEFLKNNPLVFKVKVSFTTGKIAKLEELEYINVNWNVWNREKDALVSWIKENHPSLDGFVHDMTMSGAVKYVKAIELYTSYKNKK